MLNSMSADLKVNNCNECGSSYFSEKSEMVSMCPECSYLLYGYQNCTHEMNDGRCKKCYWDGSESDFIKSKKG